MRNFGLLTALAILAAAGGCSTASVSPPVPDRSSAGETEPGGQADYVRSIENNWAGARWLARESGAVVSHRALVAPPDSSRGWDVMHDG